MKKRLISCLAMLVCILGLTACGQAAAENSFTTEEEAKLAAESLIPNLVETQTMLDSYGMTMAQYVEMNGGAGDEAAMIINAMESWKSASKEFGSFVSVIEGETVVSLSEEKANVKVKIQGDKVYKGNKQRTATVEVVMTKKGYDSISVSVDYDMSELMVRAALNTLLGMGTVFAVLILISILISCFNFIPKIQAMFQKQPAVQEKSAPAPAKAAPVVEAAVEEEADDTELIAVIAAAIAAASEGAAPAGGYVVRSIIKR